MNILRAIITANKLKDGKLDVHHYRGFSTYNCSADIGYQDYARAMRVVSEHPWLFFVLKGIRIL